MARWLVEGRERRSLGERGDVSWLGLTVQAIHELECSRDRCHDLVRPRTGRQPSNDQGPHHYILAAPRKTPTTESSPSNIGGITVSLTGRT